MLDRELEVASSLALEAGKLLLEVYGTDFDVQYKQGSDPVTEADKRANDYLVRALRERFHGDGIVAEETEDQSDALSASRCWYVDPLDGTKEFVARNGEFSVMIGLAINGSAKLGVVYKPVGNKLYRGVVGGKATLIQDGQETELRVTQIAEPKDLKLVVSRSHRSKPTDTLMERLGISHEVRSGSVGLKIGMIAEQSADFYVHLSSKSCAWDACAPEAILRAAGGRFSDLSGEDFHYGGSDMANRRGILACNASCFDRVLPTAREVAKEVGLVDA